MTRPLPHFPQKGAVLIAMLALVGMGMLYLFVAQLNASQFKMLREQDTEAALSQAREALIGYSAKESSILDAGYLAVPDTGWTGTPEGNSEGTVGGKNISVIGKFPWKTLGTPPLRDGQGECLWYVVSGYFKASPLPDPPFNWDTPGQIDIIDIGGNTIATNIAALIVAPGAVLDAQNRSLADPALAQCGGNYDARNYLDSYDFANAISGQVNYFTGSLNNLVASNTGNKQFVSASNGHYNDRFLAVTVEDVFRPIIRRSDFAGAIANLLDDPYFQTVPIAGPKGTDNVVCGSTGASNQAFCTHWKDMLLLTQLSPPSSITIDGVPSPVCSRVLVFGGQRAAGQVRATAADKSNKSNYLEGSNLAAFSTPVANSGSFNGVSAFTASNPSADVVRCLP